MEIYVPSFHISLVVVLFVLTEDGQVTEVVQDQTGFSMYIETSII